jgi:hypothetical protein
MTKSRKIDDWKMLNGWRKIYRISDRKLKEVAHPIDHSQMGWWY